MKIRAITAVFGEQEAALVDVLKEFLLVFGVQRQPVTTTEEQYWRL